MHPSWKSQDREARPGEELKLPTSLKMPQEKTWCMDICGSNKPKSLLTTQWFSA